MTSGAARFTSVSASAAVTLICGAMLVVEGPHFVGNYLAIGMCINPMEVGKLNERIFGICELLVEHLCINNVPV